MLGRNGMKRTSKFVALLLVILLAGCHWHDNTTGPGSTGYRTFVEDLEYPLDGVDLSSIDATTINGGISVTGISGTRGYVRVHKKVKADTEWEAEDFAGRVRIHIERTGDAVRIYATYPKTPHGVSVEVTFDVECPRDTDLVLGTVNGQIEIVGTDGGVRATTVNGSVEADIDLIRRDGLFTTTNGSIEVRLGTCRAPLTANTVNGAIDVALPRSFSGLLRAQAVNGRVSLGVSLSDTYVRTPNYISGRIGTGRDTPITLQAVNGSIRVSEY